MPSNGKASVRDDLNYLASFSGLMTATPSDASPDEMIAGDLLTAQRFGQRVAHAATRMTPDPSVAFDDTPAAHQS